MAETIHSKSQRKLDLTQVTLARRHLIRTPLCFLDETGTLGGTQDRFFAVGMVKLENAADFSRMMRSWRDRHHHYQEVKFHRINKGLFPIYQELLENYCLLTGATFSCFVLKKAPGWETRFGTLDRAYELFYGQAPYRRSAKNPRGHTSKGRLPE